MVLEENEKKRFVEYLETTRASAKLILGQLKSQFGGADFANFMCKRELILINSCDTIINHLQSVETQTIKG